MRCERCRRSLPEYLEDALRPAERAAVEVHLAACDTCAAELREWRVLRRALAEAPLPGDGAAEPHWAAFETRVLAHVRARTVRRRPAWFGWLVPVGAMAAVGAIVLLTGLRGGGFEPASRAADAPPRMSAAVDTRDAVAVASEMDLGWDQPLTWSLDAAVEEADGAALETLAVALADTVAWEAWDPLAMAPSSPFADEPDWLTDLDALDSEELDLFAERLESGALS